MQALTDVSEMAQKLMKSFEDALAILDCADTENAAYDKASAAFEEASSQLEELGFEYETISEGVSFSRSGTVAGEYDPATRIGAVPFLGLSGTVEVGSLDQVIDVSDFKSLNRCLLWKRYLEFPQIFKYVHRISPQRPLASVLLSASSPQLRLCIRQPSLVLRTANNREAQRAAME
jgi:hypothetical protein